MNTSPDKYLSVEERLFNENLHLRALNVANQKTILLLKIQELDKQLVEYQRQISVQREQLAKKYEVDVATLSIEQHTGKIGTSGQ